MSFASSTYLAQNQRYGVPVRWWKGFPCACADPMTGEGDPECAFCERNGKRYIEQILPPINGQPPKALPWNAKENRHDEKFGPIRVGQLMLSVLPDVMAMASGDRVMLLDDKWTETAREVIKRGATDTDATAHTPLVKVVTVLQGETNFAPGVDVLANPNGLRWPTGGGAKPLVGTRYSAEYGYRQLFTLLDVENRLRGSGSDGGGLPREFALTLEANAK